MSIGSDRRHVRSAQRRETHTGFRLVATDLDGTLLRDDLSISCRTRQILTRVTCADVRHVVVTGRPASGCRSLFDELGYRGIAVCGQGTQLYDAGRRQLLSTMTLRTDVARDAVEQVARSVGALALAVLTAGLDGHFVVTPDFDSRDEFGTCTKLPASELWDGPIERVFLRHPGLRDDELTTAAIEACGAAVTVIHSGQGMVEILPAGVSKAVGLEEAATLLGLTNADTVAFGDMPNDIPLLIWARHGVAMGNAHPALVAVADEVAPTNAEDGVAVILERMLTAGAFRSRKPSEAARADRELTPIGPDHSGTHAAISGNS